jgi:formylglycine-generating enzyme required for sulfatase activity
MSEMSKSGRLFKVFISSTYIDNVERRELVAKAVTMAGMVWHGMEIFTASTRKTTEECLRYVRESDVLVGIIAYRYGWEPDGKKSITEMEYDVSTDRLMFLIDPKTPVIPSEDFDPGPEMYEKQAKLAAFKQRISSDQMPAYFKENTLLGFVYHALKTWKEEKLVTESDKEVNTENNDAQYRVHFNDYKNKIYHFYKYLPMIGFSTVEKVPIKIEDIYIPLRANFYINDSISAAATKECLKQTPEKDDIDCYELSIQQGFLIATQKKKSGLILLGDPGSGKTTHLKKLLFLCLQDGSKSFGLCDNLFPIYIPLRDIKDSNNGLKAHIESQLSNSLINLTRDYIEYLMAKDRFLFLLDGLDEIENLDLRRKVAIIIEDSTTIFPNSKFIVTSRFSGYDNNLKFFNNLLEVHILSFTEDQSNHFIINWYSAVEKGLSDNIEYTKNIAIEKANDLIIKLKNPEFRSRRVLELTRNPLLLTNICLVHRHYGALPKSRAKLYKECINILLERWRVSKGLSVSLSSDKARKVMQPIAYWLHSTENRTVANKEEILQFVEPLLAIIRWDHKTASDFLKTIVEETGLLLNFGNDTFGFMHLCFQEYLCAREIRLRYFKDPNIFALLAKNFDNSWWKEVCLLLLAIEDEPPIFTPFMNEILNTANIQQIKNTLEQCIDESVYFSPEPFIEYIKDNKRPAILENKKLIINFLLRISPSSLNAIKDGILKSSDFQLRTWWDKKVFNDNNISRNIIPNINYEMVEIRSGSFDIGSPQSEAGRYSDESPQVKVNIFTFQIGQYPVTNEQYGIYLEQNPGEKEPKFWADREFNQPNQPVVGILWNDARKFALWAGARLPSEAEWEYACRAGTQTMYYSGDDDIYLDSIAWYRDNSGNKLRNVGEKEPNPFGLYDMLGNIWEWVEDQYHSTYEGRPINNDAWVDKSRGYSRVFRGGGWNNDAFNCRSAVRGEGSPIRYADISLGFRLAR